MSFVNDGTVAATLNWTYSQGAGTTGVTTNAGGLVIRGGSGYTSVGFAGANRIQGQWIMYATGYIATITLSAAEGGTACQVLGTATIVKLP